MLRDVFFPKERRQPENVDHSEHRVFYWKPHSGHRNFGDHLAKVIVTKVLADHGHLIEEQVRQPRQLLSVGSVLHFAEDGAVVWGSGVNGKVMRAADHRYRRLDVRAVRGPKTRAFLMDKGIAVPEVYGDPALLLPHLFPGRFARDVQRAVAVVPNLHDLQTLQQEGVADLVSPLDGWNRCIEQILQAELVVSSSLHGIIIAEAYGVPARYVRFSEVENPFKYDDYMQGTGRDRMEAARSIAEAVEMGGMAPPRFDPAPLLAAFPLDVWN